MDEVAVLAPVRRDPDDGEASMTPLVIVARVVASTKDGLDRAKELDVA